MTSFNNFAAVIAVKLFISLSGLYSTMSAPMTLPSIFDIISITSLVDKPPGSGWDTPGAKAGSSPSRSIECILGQQNSILNHWKTDSLQ